MLRFALVGLALLVASHSYAQAPPAPIPTARPTPEPSGEELDYRGYLALSDATALALVLSAAGAKGTGSEVLVLSAAGVYALGAPTVHLLNDQPVRATVSLGLRVGLPAALGGIGVGLSSVGCHPSTSTYDGYDGYPDPDPDNGSECDTRRAVAGVFGAGVGMLIAIIADDGFLGRAERRPAVAPGNAKTGAKAAGQELTRPQFQFTLAPVVLPRGDGAGVMAIGIF